MGRSITKEELNSYEREEFRGTIVVANDFESSKKAVERLSENKILGFDTETRPSFRKGNTNNVALIQLASEDFCCLFRLNITGYFPHLIELLSNPDIMKIGLSLKDDFHSLEKNLNFEPRGFIDLQKIAPKYGIEDMSLQKIYALLFHKKISKNQRLTNWEASTLTAAQQHYAALDAWACLKIYKKLCL
ncbi:MAG: 3'-5' exonuclease domain-containing protein 2 [Dysgonamonadaceae bacterium]|jgi:ribonuclease D|nr:3'-5' exonuclease domain-containing protein 2 [Dysgonamonadaceae bacterium]